jgi:anti-sigma factor RsiW
MNTPSPPHRLELQLSAYLDGELPPDEMMAVRQHLAQCPSCEAELEALRDTKRLLGRLGPPEPPRDLEDGILARASGEPSWPRRAWPWLTLPRPAMVAAAVALAVLLVAVPVVRDRRDRLRAAEVSPDLFIRTAVQSSADDPFMDRAYLSLISSDVNLRLAGEEPRAVNR